MDINFILLASAVLGGIALISAIILFFIAKAFKVEEDPLIDEVAENLPGANCGGCGYPGCRGLADAIVKAGSLEGLNCPAGGSDTMTRIAEILGVTPVVSDPVIAVLKCNGTCELAPAKSFYDSALSCAYAATLFSGESGCQYGCLGCGDCVNVCKFDALKMDPVTKLPVVSEENCVGCGACVKACPRLLFEIRKKGIKNRRIYVACSNIDKGGYAKKNCDVACIGCSKCVKVCAFDAITVNNNLAYIDETKCKLCRKCVTECPTNCIHEVNFPPKKEVKAVEEVMEAVN
jgi:Na+-translocating ferredoxin:NAD+ oxidoreductase RNF subunit RnfB